MKKLILITLGMSALIILGIHNIFQDKKHTIEFQEYLKKSKIEPLDILSDEVLVYQALQTQKIVTIEPGGSLCKSLGMTVDEAGEFMKMYNLPKNHKGIAILHPGDQFINVFIQSQGKHVWFPRITEFACLDVD